MKPDRDQIALDAAHQIEALPNDLHEGQKTARIQLIILEALSAPKTDRDGVIDECLRAARDGFEASMDNYVLIGPSGMARSMLNSISNLKSAPAQPEDRKP